VRGLDLLDGTPVLDVKPYVPYCDAFPTAAAGWVDLIPEEEDRLPYWPPPQHLLDDSASGPADGPSPPPQHSPDDSARTSADGPQSDLPA